MVDSENNFIKGRLKEIIIKAGTNVSPLSGKVLLKSFPEIDHVCDRGPDERWVRRSERLR